MPQRYRLPGLPQRYRCPQRYKLQRAFGWLLGLMPETAAYSGQVQHLLSDPEMRRCSPPRPRGNRAPSGGEPDPLADLLAGLLAAR